MRSKLIFIEPLKNMTYTKKNVILSERSESKDLNQLHTIDSSTRFARSE